MTNRRSALLLLATALGVLTVGCASPPGPVATSGPGPSGPDPSGPGPTTTFGPIAPPPAEVLDATVVYFDADGTDQQPGSPPPSLITDQQALDAFTRRYVDGDPVLGTAALQALVDGQVLVGAAVSSGCFPADGAQLAFTAADIRLLPTGLSSDDPDVDCVRAITSIALVAVDAADLPPGLPVRGT